MPGEGRRRTDSMSTVTTPVGRIGPLTIMALESQLNTRKRVTLGIKITAGQTHDRDDQAHYHFLDRLEGSILKQITKRKNNDNTRVGTCLALRPWRDELTIATFKHVTLSTGSTARSTTTRTNTQRIATRPLTMRRHYDNSE